WPLLFVIWGTPPCAGVGATKAAIAPAIWAVPLAGGPAADFTAPVCSSGLNGRTGAACPHALPSFTGTGSSSKSPARPPGAGPCGSGGKQDGGVDDEAGRPRDAGAARAVLGRPGLAARALAAGCGRVERAAERRAAVSGRGVADPVVVGVVDHRRDPGALERR